MHLVAKSPEDLLSSFVDGPDDDEIYQHNSNSNKENRNNKHKKLVRPDKEHVMNNNKENMHNKQRYTAEENEAYHTIVNNIRDPNELSQILQTISLNNTISSRQKSSNDRRGKQKQHINKKKKKSKPKQQKHDNNKVEDTLANENYFMKQIRLIYEAAGSKIEFDNIDLDIVIAIVDHFTESSPTTATNDAAIDDIDEKVGVDTDDESLDAIEFSCNALSLPGSGGGGSIVYALNNVMLGVTKAIFPASSWSEDC